MLDVQKLSKLGIGIWGVGGFATRETDSADAAQVDALAYTLEKGINYVNFNFWNADGQTAELVKQAIDASGKKREDLFLALAIYNYNNPALADLEREIQKFFDLFQTDYI